VITFTDTGYNVTHFKPHPAVSLQKYTHLAKMLNGFKLGDSSIIEETPTYVKYKLDGIVYEAYREV